MKRTTKAEFLKKVADIRACGVAPNVYSRGTSVYLKNDLKNTVEELALCPDYPSAMKSAAKYKGWL